MKNREKMLTSWGYDSSFLGDREGNLPEHLIPARVISVFRSSWIITDGQSELNAEPVGRLLYALESPLDLPTVGDWVLSRTFEEQGFAVIEEVLPRKSLLKRKTPGKKVDFQLIAANVDGALLVQSLDENFSLRRLERYLAMVLESGILPIVLLSKSDLLSEEESLRNEHEITEKMPDLQVLRFTNTDEDDWRKVLLLLESGKTYCMLGSSGVGKTTLLNNLLGEAAFETSDVRDYDSKGRHTTTSRQLIRLRNGAMMVDTPGMRELGNFSIGHGIDETFSEISLLTANCRFSDCSHTNEPGCAVLQALEEGELDRSRYQSYLQLERESRFGEMSYAEKRQQDRKRGKFYKSVMKDNKKRM